MTAIVDLIGWPLALGCLAVAACAIWRGVRGRDGEHRLGALITALMFLTAAFAGFTVVGVLSPLAGGLLASVAAVPAVLLVKPWRREAPGLAWGHASDGAGWLHDAIRSAWRLLAGRLHGQGDAGEAGPIPLDAVPAHAAARAIPSVMEDPLLGPPPEPADLASAAIPVPAPWAALATYIATREPEDDQQLRIFSDGDAAGALAVADAYHAYADTCLNGLGLSPAYVAGVLEAGDSAAGHASVIAQIHKRFGVIYGAVKEWVSAHGPLPHKAREFLTESD